MAADRFYLGNVSAEHGNRSRPDEMRQMGGPFRSDSDHVAGASWGKAAGHHCAH